LRGKSFAVVFERDCVRADLDLFLLFRCRIGHLIVHADEV
jgi:hypothetical protein